VQRHQGTEAQREEGLMDAFVVDFEPFVILAALCEKMKTREVN